MTLIEVGGLASALVAIITLISKLVTLITAIHNLINRLDKMAIDIEEGDKERLALAQSISRQDIKLHDIETLFSEVRRELIELKTTVKELVQRVN
ncbi:hypothetical protein ACTQ45_13235 [Fundicoccus sp. Sow4_D5]|uniref:hypothetical protein n=1 Tax=Fundicoccus sp. Sow4_D5 TaxID=3438782 RepID=UPI003F92940A